MFFRFIYNPTVECNGTGIFTIFCNEGKSKERNLKMAITKKWLKCAGIRALKTVAQTAVSAIGTEAVFSEVKWHMVLSASLLAGILSILMSVGGLPECREDTNNE